MKKLIALIAIFAMCGAVRDVVPCEQTTKPAPETLRGYLYKESYGQLLKTYREDCQVPTFFGRWFVNKDKKAHCGCLADELDELYGKTIRHGSIVDTPLHHDDPAYKFWRK